MSLATSALLVQLSISQPIFRKIDAKATRDVAQVNGVSERVGQYNKTLLPGTDLLRKIHAKSTYIRAFFARSTLPWGMEGTQILRAESYLGLMAEMRAHKNEWENLVDAFVVAYPQLVTAAQGQLLGMFNASDYPDPADVRGKFALTVTVLPVPSADFRVAVSETELAALRESVEAHVLEAQAAAMREAWTRLRDRVGLMAAKLADPDAIFHNSLVENTKEVCDLLAGLNIANDADLEAMRQEVMAKLIVPPEALRISPTHRSNVATAAADIMEKMKGYM